MYKIVMDYDDSSQIFLFLESPAEHVKIPGFRLCPRSIKPDSPEEGPSLERNLRFPRRPLCAVRFENKAVINSMGSDRGGQPFGVSGPHWKKKNCLGPHIKYIATCSNKKFS